MEILLKLIYQINHYQVLNRSKKLLGHLKEISVVDFDHKDVVRHPLVSKIVKAYSDKRLLIKANVISDHSNGKDKIKNLIFT